MATTPARKQRCASHISISSGEPSPEGRRPSIISISSGDGSPRPTKRRRVNVRVEKEKESMNENVKATSDEPAISNDAIAALEARRMELMRQWVDDGIQMAIDEMNGKGRDEKNISSNGQLPTKVNPTLHKPHPAPPATPRLAGPSTSHITRPPTASMYSTPYPNQIASYSSNQGYAAPMYPQQHSGIPIYAPAVLHQSHLSSNLYAPPPSYQHNYSHIPPVPSTNHRPVLGPVAANVPRYIQLEPPGGVHILSPEMYLSFYELENIYCPDKDNFSLRSAWLSQIELNFEPFKFRYTAAYKRQVVEDAWVELGPNKRRFVEYTAVMAKHNTKVDFKSTPIRTVPPSFLPLSFYALELEYFNVPARQLTDYRDIMSKRTIWLKDLNLNDPLYHSLCVSQAQEEAVEKLYTSTHSVAERRKIQVKAAYLRVMLDPSRPS